MRKRTKNSASLSKGDKQMARIPDCHPDRKHEAHGLCKNCYLTKWHKEHYQEQDQFRHAKYLSENKEACRERVRIAKLKNIEKVKQYNARWMERNRGLMNFYHRTYRAKKLQACPVWADLKKIKDIYKEAARMRQETGLDYEVDHIIPLQGREVCGLHIAENLQIILQHDNASKSNKFLGGN